MSRVRLFKRPDRPYWYLEFPGPDGAPLRESTGLRDEGAAQVLRAARELELARGAAGIPVAGAITLLDATAEYLVEREPDLAAKWHATVEGFVKNQVLPAFGEARVVSTIEAADVARFRAAQVARPDLRVRSDCCRRRFVLGTAGAWLCEKCSAVAGDDVKRISPTSVNRLLWAMGAFGTWCVERRYHLTNPWSQPSFAEGAEPPPPIAQEDLDRIFAALEARPQTTFPWRALFELARETGLRRGELERLARRDIHTADRLAYVVSAHARGLNKGKRTREVALNGRALEVLEQLPKRKDGLVFGPVPDARRAFRAAAKATGLERVWLHLMRHVGATETGRVGASLADIMRFGGWASPRMAQRYTHSDHRRQLELQDRREAARAAAKEP
jgi:site-specific recombinase XerD